MKTKLNLLAAGILLTALGTGFGQSTLQFTASIYTVAENAGSVILTVQRTGDTNGAVSVDYASTNGTAIAGSDYTATNGTLTFAAGETNLTIVVPILNDGIVEPAAYETFTVTLSNPTNAVLGARTVATVRITDNDKGLALEFASYSVAENAGSVLIGVTRSDDGDFPVSVDYSTTDGAAKNGLDYTGVTNTLVFAAGDKVRTLTVPILNDGLKELNETFRVTLSNPTNQVLVAAQKIATVTIVDNDQGFQCEWASCSVAEDAGVARIRVLRGSEENLAATVDYATSDGTATNGLKYTATNGTLTFAPGETIHTIMVPLLNDSVVGGDKYFRVTLSNPTNAILGSPKVATVTIRDNDTGLHFYVPTVVVNEDAGEVTIKVARGDDGDTQVSVDYATTNGTALAGQDYTATNGTLAFAPGELLKSITVPIFSDALAEPVKTFQVTLSHPTGGAVLGTQALATVTVTDANPPQLRGVLDGSYLNLDWGARDGKLQEAPTPTGPWQTVTTALWSHRTVRAYSQRYYRLVLPAPGKKWLTVAAVTMTSQPDTEANLQTFFSYMEQAASERVDLIVFPEVALQQCPAWGTSDYTPTAQEMAYMQQTAEMIPGESTSNVVAKARELNLFVVFGMTEKDQAGLLYNANVFLGPDGVIGKHRKSYFIGNDSQIWRLGSGYAVLDSAIGKIGLMICIETWSGGNYPGPILAGQGADLLVTCSAWGSNGGDSWAPVTVENAIRANRWDVASQQVGLIGHVDVYGHSLIVDPKGTIVCDSGTGQGLVMWATDILIDARTP